MSAIGTSPVSDVANERHSLPWLPIERLPEPVLCVPLIAHWMWQALRYRSLTLPSAINPAIETGGLAGESKSVGLAQIGASFARFVAPWRLVGPGEDPVAICRAAGLDLLDFDAGQLGGDVGQQIGQDPSPKPDIGNRVHRDPCQALDGIAAQRGQLLAHSDGGAVRGAFHPAACFWQTLGT